jgi:Holliday junction DNA helicase RuvA
MFAYLSGKITHRSPTAIHLDVNGVGYEINISLNTFSEIENKDDVKLYTHLYMREDIHTILLYGFYTLVEKDLFLLLTSVSGIGMNTARIILSSLHPIEVKAAIASGDANTFKKVKGIGGKTADRLILDLKDKITRLATDDELKEMAKAPVSTSSNEAVAALVSLGFQKAKAEKAVASAVVEGDKLEDVVKAALKLLT